MSTLWDTIKKGLKDGAKIAKDSAQVAAEKAEVLGKKSKVHIEISSVKRKIEKNFTELGGKAYHLIKEENVKNVATHDEVKEILKTLSALEEDLKSKQDELEKIGVAYQAETESDNGSTETKNEEQA